MYKILFTLTETCTDYFEKIKKKILHSYNDCINTQLFKGGKPSTGPWAFQRRKQRLEL